MLLCSLIKSQDLIAKVVELHQNMLAKARRETFKNQSTRITNFSITHKGDTENVLKKLENCTSAQSFTMKFATLSPLSNPESSIPLFNSQPARFPHFFDLFAGELMLWQNFLLRHVLFYRFSKRISTKKSSISRALEESEAFLVDKKTRVKKRESFCFSQKFPVLLVTRTYLVHKKNYSVKFLPWFCSQKKNSPSKNFLPDFFSQKFCLPIFDHRYFCT